MPLTTVTHVFSPQGLILVGARNPTTGAVTTYTDLGNAPKLSIALKTDTEILKESTSGQRLDMQRLEKGKSAEVTMELHNFDKRTLAMLLRSSAEAVASGTVATETMPTGLVAGSIVKLAYPFASNIILTDSAGTPATVDAADYQVDAEGGMIRMLDVTGYTQPFKAAYDFAGNETMALFSQGKSGYELVFTGVNTAMGNEPMRVELYNVEFDPSENLDLITESANVFSLKGSMLIDPSKDAADPLLGQFGRVIRKSA
jgi:hypothetical protein